MAASAEHLPEMPTERVASDQLPVAVVRVMNMLGDLLPDHGALGRTRTCTRSLRRRSLDPSSCEGLVPFISTTQARHRRFAFTTEIQHLGLNEGVVTNELLLDLVERRSMVRLQFKKAQLDLSEVDGRWSVPSHRAPDQGAPASVASVAVTGHGIAAIAEPSSLT